MSGRDNISLITQYKTHHCYNNNNERCVIAYKLQFLPCVFGIDVVDLSFQFENLLCLDGNICCLPLKL